MSENASSSVLLTPAEMQHADRLAIEDGASSSVLMERAGGAVAAAITERFASARSISLLAGPGNNGGDAFVVGRVLRAGGRTVRMYVSGSYDALRGDAAEAAHAFGAETEPLASFDPHGADVIVDGLFGAGLARNIEGEAKTAIEKANASGKPIVAIDLPSGISGLTGEVLGGRGVITLTITFFQRKPGHLLEPGRSHCGETLVADIGIGSSVLERIGSKTFANDPALWRSAFLRPDKAGHKYDRGHAVVFSGGATKTGAARMSAHACLRIGAGLVTVFAPASALMANAAHLTAIMLQRCEDEAELRSRLEDARFNAFVIGPSFGIGEKARAFAFAVLSENRSIVLDADAISSFREGPERLFEAVGQSRGEAVLTPHAGEFARIFPDIANEPGSKLDRARQAAKRSGAVVVFKGSDTVIAAPDGRAAINDTGTPYLATAGTGDVLAGMIGGLLSQKMPAFEAACAAVWMHGMAARRFGPGLIAEDLPGEIPAVLRMLWNEDDSASGSLSLAD